MSRKNNGGFNERELPLLSSLRCRLLKGKGNGIPGARVFAPKGTPTPHAGYLLSLIGLHFALLSNIQVKLAIVDTTEPPLCILSVNSILARCVAF